MREKLLGKDLRSISKVDDIVKIVNTQKQFDELFSFLYEGNRLLAMRSIDAIEKITRKFPQFLDNHKKELFAFSKIVTDIEFKWHLALLLSRIHLNNSEKKELFYRLTSWALNKSESKIVRVNAIQSLHDTSVMNPSYKKDFLNVIHDMKGEQIPSLTARIKKLTIYQEENQDET